MKIAITAIAIFIALHAAASWATEAGESLNSKHNYAELLK